MIQKIRQIKLLVSGQWSVRHVGFVMLAIAVIIAIIGYLNLHRHWLTPLPFVADFYANISTELASVAVTVLVIDALNERRAIQQEKATLILQMSSPTNAIAREAVRVLRVRGWLMDGTLKRANLLRANLRKAFLEKADLCEVFLLKADLSGAYLQWANLKGARELELTQLVQIAYFRGATLPNGIRYDGRFNLAGDLKWARHKKIAPDNPQAMADFYEVPLQIYLEGQEWARENLAKLQQEAAAGHKAFKVGEEWIS